MSIREAAALDGVTGVGSAPLHRPADDDAGDRGHVLHPLHRSFRVFDNVYALVGTGAGGSTTTMSIYIYRAFFKVGDVGLAVAASMLLLVASFVVLFAINKLTARSKPA